MLKSIPLVCIAVLLLGAATPRSDFPKKYKVVEAYEVRPGVLMMPRYAEDGEVCEMGLQERHYSPELIRTQDISRDEIGRIVDDLVPASERGKKADPVSILNSSFFSGQTLSETEEYENITIQIYSAIISPSEEKMQINDVAAVIRWKHRKCQ